MLRKIINIEHLIHSTKTFIAVCIGILFTYVITFPSDQWVVITIIVVMCSQLYVGSVLQKSYLRFVGTLLGCLFAIIALVTMGENRLVIFAAVGLSSFIFSYISVGHENLNYACTLGAVTTAIIMLGGTPTITFAAERFLEISVGLLIATLVSQFILPINARDHLRRAQRDTLEQIREYYRASLTKESDYIDNLNYMEMDEAIVKTLLKQRQLAVESKREHLGETLNQNKFLQTIYSEKELLRAITFMHQAYKKILKASPQFAALPSLANFNQTTIVAFDTLINSLDARTPHANIVIPSIDNLSADCEQYLHTVNNLLYLEGFIYCAELLCVNLAKLATLTGCVSKQ